VFFTRLARKPFASHDFRESAVFGIKIVMFFPWDFGKILVPPGLKRHRRQPASRNLNLVD
jgi:hypothetical protein